MGLKDNLSDALGVEHVPVEENKPQQITLYTPDETEDDGTPLNIEKDTEDDYRLARRVLRNLITKGNAAIDQISEIARQQESARSYEVVSTLIKTVGETTKDLYQLQKTTRELQAPSKDSDPRVKGEQGNINVEQAVFVGSAAELLSAIKKKKEEEELNG